jgi:hypothetical protein
MPMTINKMYIITIDGIRRIVYDGICGDIPTKWITQGEWDYTITIRFDKEINDLVYTDSNKKEILVFEEGEEGYNIY